MLSLLGWGVQLSAKQKAANTPVGKETKRRGKAGSCGVFLHLFVFVNFCFATDLQIPLNVEPECPGFSWDKVNFLPSSWYSAVFWI